MIFALLLLTNSALAARRYDSNVTKDTVKRDVEEIQKREFKKSTIFDDKIMNLIDNATNIFETTDSSCNSQPCVCFRGQIKKDLDIWKYGINETDLLFLFERKHQNVHYQVRDGILYRSRSCFFPARCKGIEHFLLKILHELPDMDFFVNVKDWPQVGTWNHKQPIFSFSKQPRNYIDIMYPAWTFWEGGPAVWPLYPNGLGRWDQMRDEILKIVDNQTWETKKSIGYFRGSRTSEERDPLIKLSRAKPELIQAAYTKNQAYKREEDTLFEDPVEPVHEKFCKKNSYIDFQNKRYKIFQVERTL